MNLIIFLLVCFVLTHTLPFISYYIRQNKSNHSRGQLPQDEYINKSNRKKETFSYSSNRNKLYPKQSTSSVVADIPIINHSSYEKNTFDESREAPTSRLVESPCSVRDTYDELLGSLTPDDADLIYDAEEVAYAKECETFNKQIDEDYECSQHGYRTLFT